MTIWDKVFIEKVTTTKDHNIKKVVKVYIKSLCMLKWPFIFVRNMAVAYEYSKSEPKPLLTPELVEQCKVFWSFISGLLLFLMVNIDCVKDSL